MLPAQRNKIDISKLTPQEQQLFAKYGKLPTHKNVLMKVQKERKYFDSGDYALSKAGVTPQSTVGTAIPNPENIPHATGTCPPSNGHQIPNTSPTSTSPVNRESSLAHNSTKAEFEGEEEGIEVERLKEAEPLTSTAVSTSTIETPDNIGQEVTMGVKETNPVQGTN